MFCSKRYSGVTLCGTVAHDRGEKKGVLLYYKTLDSQYVYSFQGYLF